MGKKKMLSGIQNFEWEGVKGITSGLQNNTESYGREGMAMLMKYEGFEMFDASKSALSLFGANVQCEI